MVLLGGFWLLLSDSYGVQIAQVDLITNEIVNFGIVLQGLHLRFVGDLTSAALLINRCWFLIFRLKIFLQGFGRILGCFFLQLLLGGLLLTNVLLICLNFCQIKRWNQITWPSVLLRYSSILFFLNLSIWLFLKISNSCLSVVYLKLTLNLIELSFQLRLCSIIATTSCIIPPKLLPTFRENQ